MYYCFHEDERQKTNNALPKMNGKGCINSSKTIKGVSMVKMKDKGYINESTRDEGLKGYFDGSTKM